MIQKGSHGEVWTPWTKEFALSRLPSLSLQQTWSWIHRSHHSKADATRLNNSHILAVECANSWSCTLICLDERAMTPPLIYITLDLIRTQPVDQWRSFLFFLPSCWSRSYLSNHLLSWTSKPPLLCSSSRIPHGFPHEDLRLVTPKLSQSSASLTACPAPEQGFR